MLAFLNILDSQDDKDKFVLFYNKYNRLVIWLSLKKLNNNRALAEEAAQECFFYFADNFEKIDDIDSPRTKRFVAIVAEAFAINAYRAESKNASNLSFEDEYLFNNDEFDFDSINEFELKSAINKLPDESRNLLYLKYIYGLKSKEIAEILGISDALVRKRIQLAKKKVRDIMESED